ncbi:PE-PPE domain-containing protein [Mycolicibacterium wolinskyi]|uniref:PE-PPE domain-containing protein n=1 Tax=Mycolicibacterium wolinskyi TaxID=59750 RepID=UPI003917A587
MSKPTPPRLQKAKAAAVTAAVVATTAALTAGAASQAPEAYLAHKRTVEAEVALAALPEVPGLDDLLNVPDLVGIYGVGPVFWAAQLLGLTPTDVIQAAAGLLGGSEVAGAVTGLLELLDAISPVDAGIKGPLPSDVYNAVNGLEYTLDGVTDILGEPIQAIPIVGDLIWNAIDGLVAEIINEAPILNQRRAIIFSESLGGLTTSLAYRDMIKAVQSNDPNWGEGVTGQWLIFFNNPSRPGGGLFALATPITNLFGLNLSTPPAGSYTNEDADGDITKVLNTSILDISWAYNILSDAPTTLNPLAWANAATGAVFLTYLLPSEGNNIASHVLPQAVAGILDGLKVMVDITGGQGLEMVPGWNEIVNVIDDLDILNLGLDEALEAVANATKFPGTATYITYDSGNLPLLEPFRMVPRLVSLLPGVDIPTPITDSFEEALRMMVNMGYQDVDPVTLERGFDMAGEQAYFYDSPLTPTQKLAARQTIFNALIDGIQENALDPQKWTPTIPGIDLSPVFENPLTETAAAALSAALEAMQDAANPMFDAVETGLAPVTGVLDDIDAQVTAALDNVFKVNEPAPGGPASPLSATSVPSDDNTLRTLNVSAEDVGPVVEKADETTDETTEDTKATPIKDAVKDLDAETDSLKDREPLKGLKKITESFKASPGKHTADAGDPVKKSVQETVDKVKDTVDKVEQAGKDAVKKVEKAANDAKDSVSKKPAKETSKDKAAA